MFLIVLSSCFESLYVSVSWALFSRGGDAAQHSLPHLLTLEVSAPIVFLLLFYI